MAFSGGVFTRLYSWVTDAGNGVKISSSRMDAEMDGFATGLSACLLKDGTQTVTANIPLAGYKLTGVGDATVSGDAVHYGQISTYAWTLLDDANAAAAQTTLGLGIGINVQAFGPVLDDLNTLGAAASDGEFIVATGAGAFAYESGATVRTSLGLGSSDSPTFANPQITTIELGHASDTTLARSAAGVVTIEGNRAIMAGDNGDSTVQKINLQDYGEVTNAIGSIGGGTQDIDLTSGNVVTATVDTSTTTFTFSNPTASDEGCSFTLVLTNGGSQTVNWPASVDWAGGTAPTLTAAGVDILEFITVNGGTTWYGFAAGLDMQ